MIDGIANGRLTRNSTCRGVMPIPVATLMASAGTDRRPVSALRNINKNVYPVRPISMVIRPNPVTGTKSRKNASDGIVYNNVENAVKPRSNQPTR